MSTTPRLIASDVSAAPIEIKEEIKRQGELHLAAQLQAGIAADQRAMSFVSLMAAAAVVVAGGGAALLLGTPVHELLGWICVGMAASFAVAMGLAIESAAPADFHYGGGAPFDWKEDIATGASYADALTEVLVHLDERITFNSAVLTKNARWMWWAVRVSWFGLTAGGILGVAGLIYR